VVNTMSTQNAERVATGMQRLTLQFRDPDVEQRYQSTRAESDLRRMRLSLGAGIVINMGFAPLDYLVLSQNLTLALILRIAVITFAFAGVLGMSWLSYFRTRLGYIAAFAILAFTLLYAALIAESNPPDVYLSGYVLVILFLLVFVPVGFVNASAISWTCTGIFATLTPLIRTVDLGSLLTIYSQFVAANLMGMFALYWMERLHRLDYLSVQEIADERSRYRSLLTRILPNSIVERLEGGEEGIADDYAESTVLFADIVGFTEISTRNQPAAMVAFLNRVFGRYDELVARHGVEKIKTIGDAYMVAGGLPEARPDHAEAIAELALDMFSETKRMESPDGNPVQIRIGIDTGPLTAGVIGESRFLYDLWGDTVNTASRMESQGAPGRIQVSETVYQRLRAKYRFKPLEEVNVKGKGSMTTWQLVDRLPDAASPTA
jgi:adenylate cyclase